MEITGLSRKLIKPSIPTSEHLQRFNLSLFDQVAPVAHVSMIFYYPANDENSDNEKLACLENSLSEALVQYYPLAGRFIKEDLCIDCSDQGVEYIEAEVNGCLDEFLQGGRESEIVNRFVPWDIGAPDMATTPLLAIQMNMFTSGGLVLGVRFSHIIADACSMVSFIKGWASVCRVGIDSLIPPGFSSASLFPGIKSLEIKPPAFHENGPRILMKRFVFDRFAVQALKDKSRANTSKVVAVTSLIWKAIMNISQAKNPGISTAFVMNMLMNLRGKTGFSLPETLFGNLCSLVTTKTIATKSVPEFQELAATVGDAITKASEECAEKQNPGEILKMVIDTIKQFKEEARKGEKVEFHAFTSWCRFGIYEADFGWGKPGWVSSGGLPAEAVLLMDNKSGDGVEAWVYLNEKDMVTFEQDLDIVAFNSLSR